MPESLTGACASCIQLYQGADVAVVPHLHLAASHSRTHSERRCAVLCSIARRNGDHRCYLSGDGCVEARCVRQARPLIENGRLDDVLSYCPDCPDGQHIILALSLLMTSTSIDACGHSRAPDVFPKIYNCSVAVACNGLQVDLQSCRAPADAGLVTQKPATALSYHHCMLLATS